MVVILWVGLYRENSENSDVLFTTAVYQAPPTSFVQILKNNIYFLINIYIKFNLNY